MTNQEIVSKTKEFVKETMSGDSGHDWWHALRVYNLAKKIAQQEKGADLFIVELGALLHDIADWKFHDSDKEGGKVTRNWLESLGLDESIVGAVEHIVDNVSYKGAKVENTMKSLEGKIVQDADRLDALGAIGIGRTFVYGGHTGSPMWDPNIKPVLHETAKDYKSSKGTTINHFYEKLLLLKDKMNTETAKQMAQKRHDFMEEFLKEFFSEWEGKS